MPLSAGTKLGCYEVVAQVGAGGMGEVYQAHDSKLGRDVAVKVLPEAFAHDAERLSRFQREAKMLASLNHPNVATTQRDIWLLRLGDPSASSGQVRKAQPFLQTPSDEAVPRFSPDGRWLAYTSNESGRYEIYVQPYPGPGGKWQISTEGGTEPAWNPNGRELFYRSGEKMMAVDIASKPGFAAGTPRILFQGRYDVGPVPSVDYDVSPDGQRFPMLKSTEQEQAAPTQINIVLNWFEELKRRVPTGTK